MHTYNIFKEDENNSQEFVYIKIFKIILHPTYSYSLATSYFDVVQ